MKQGDYNKTKCLRCGTLTVHKSSVCQPCRTRKCTDCGKSFQATVLKWTQCATHRKRRPE
jgi:uncharacterized OB-fold protein